MATIDEIFENMPAEASVTYEELIIDAENRIIIVPDAEAIFGVESDTHSERKHFRCPRYVGDGLDLASCFLRVNFRNANGDVDSYLVTDVSIDGEYITFSWELSRKVTAYKGAVQFNVCAIMGAGLPEWNTTLAEGTVLEGLEPDSSTAEEETADVIAQLLAKVAAQTAAVEAVGAAQVAAVTEAGNNATEEAKAAVEAKGEAVRASIPEDYSTLSATVDKLTRDRAAAIVCEAEGETIQVNDSSADPLVGLRIFGKSTQDGTPTPDAPVEIVSAKAPTVTVCGKNILNLPDVEDYTINGVTFTSRGGVVTVKGTATVNAATSSKIYKDFAGMKGVYTISGSAGDNTTFVWVQIRKADGSAEWISDRSFELDGTETFVRVYVQVGQGHTVDHTIYPMLTPGSVALPWEPYRGGTLTVSTPTALPGIPVTSGGNYTDANGQQWIADEIDLARGVYVQKVGAKTFIGKDKEDWGMSHSGTFRCHSITTAFLCQQFESVIDSRIVGNHEANTLLSDGQCALRYADVIDRAYFKWSGITTLADWLVWLSNNPVTVIHALKTPIETPLSTEEVEAYKALLANKPTTTVLNDAGAWMTLEYAADPKTYIDNKIAALLAANN